MPNAKPVVGKLPAGIESSGLQRVWVNNGETEQTCDHPATPPFLERQPRNEIERMAVRARQSPYGSTRVIIYRNLNAEATLRVPVCIFPVTAEFKFTALAIF